MDNLVDRLGAKEPGDLIWAGDGGWNELVAEVSAMHAQVQAGLEALAGSVAELTEVVRGVDARVAAVEATATQLRADLETFEAHVEPLNYRVTLRTTKVSHAIGETAEITAQVKDLRGRPVNDRPWIDFICSWGQFSPADGFENSSRGGAGARTIAVQTNEDGLARVRLGAAVLEGLSVDAQKEVNTFLQTRLATDASIADTVVNATTSVEATEAFEKVTEHYDRAETALRSFADDYYVKNAPPPWRVLSVPEPEFRWRDFRATVLAVAKSDTDPTTADESRGTASIQLTFRDWVMPWLKIHYLGTAQKKTLADRVKLTSAIVSDPEQVKLQVEAIAPDTGLLGRMRSFEVLKDAVSDFAKATPTIPAQTVDRAQEAVAIKQTIEAPIVAPTFSTRVFLRR